MQDRRDLGAEATGQVVAATPRVGGSERTLARPAGPGVTVHPVGSEEPEVLGAAAQSPPTQHPTARRPCLGHLAVVVSLPPVTLTIPLSEVRTVWRRDRSAVRSLDAPFCSGRAGPEPDQMPVMSAR